MEKVAKSLEVPKELDEALSAVNKLISEGKKALADGFQPGQDIPAVLGGCMQDMMKAFDGFSKIAPEYQEDPSASDHCFALALADMKGIFLS